jgi:hypothetical protein
MASFAEKTAEQVLLELNTHQETGLTSLEADFRRTKYGPCVFGPKK